MPSAASGDGRAGLCPAGAGAGRVRVRIAVDAMGGDFAPLEIVEGARLVADDGIEPIIYGPPGLETHGLRLVETDGVIDSPRGAAKILNLHPNTLRSRLKKLGISRTRHDPS